MNTNVYTPAKVRLSEQKAKFIWTFSNESTFDEVRGTIK